jgi:partner of Y14 and mago protein
VYHGLAFGTSSDGCRLRKELKVRPGFTPQEDVGRFRPRQTESSKSFVPGSNGRQSAQQLKAKSENPFAAENAPVPESSSSKTKAQLKNEKRREKKRLEAANKGWDESDTDDDEGALEEAFAEEDRKHSEAVDNGGRDVDGDKAGVSSTKAKSGPGAGVGVPAPSLLEQTQEDGATSSVHVDHDATEILSPAVGPGDSPETASAMPGAPEIDPATFKPKVQSTKPVNNPTSQSSSQRQQKQPQPRSQNVPGAGGQRQPRQRNPQQVRSANSGKELLPTPEPRVRKEVKIRQGGANGISSLADRVKNLVLDNQAGRKERKTSEPPAPVPAAGEKA